MNTTLENNSLSLKWGTLKSWDLSNSERGKKLLQEYREIGMSFSAMGQDDNPRQKEIICELIDLCEDGTVWLDWDGEQVSNERAKEYIMTYASK